MIAGASADNLLLVVETQRKGAEVLKQVQEDIRGVGDAARGMNERAATAVAETTSRLESMAKTVDVTSKAEVAALRQNVQGLKDLALAAQATESELGDIVRVEQVLEARLKAATQEARAQAAALSSVGNVTDKMSPKVMTAARAMSTLSFSAAGFTAGGHGAVMAAGNLASSLATLSTSAAIAASATGIGAVAIALGTLIPLLRGAKGEADDLSASLLTIGREKSPAAIANMIASIENNIKNTKEQIEAAKAATEAWTVEGAATAAAALARGDVVAAASWAVRTRLEDQGLENLKANLEAQTAALKTAKARQYQIALDDIDKRISLAEREAERLKRQREQDAKTATALLISVPQSAELAWLRYHDRYEEAERKQLQFSRERRLKEIEELKVSAATKKQLEIDAEDAIHAATAQLDRDWKAKREAFARSNRAMEASSGSVAAGFAFSMETIELEAEAARKAGHDIEEIERNKQLKIRQLRRETLRGTLGDLKTLEEATIDSRSREIRAIGLAASAFRRIMIGAEAADATVKSAKEFARVPAFLASHQYGSAALAFASGTQFAAAAALGFREAMGGGGGGSAGGAGGSSGGSAGDRGTFEPTRGGSGGPGPIVIQVITRNPYGRDSIQNVMFELERRRLLNAPGVEIPPSLLESVVGRSGSGVSTHSGLGGFGI